MVEELSHPYVCLSPSTTPGMYGWAPKAEASTGSRAVIRSPGHDERHGGLHISPCSMMVRDSMDGHFARNCPRTASTTGRAGGAEEEDVGLCAVRQGRWHAQQRVSWRGAATLYAAKDGTLWFATAKGLVHTDPMGGSSGAHPAEFNWRLVGRCQRASEQSFGAIAGLEDLVFQFNSQNLANPAQMEFRYKLDGYDRIGR